jgi:hypothetical protein
MRVVTSASSDPEGPPAAKQSGTHWNENPPLTFRHFEKYHL